MTSFDERQTISPKFTKLRDHFPEEVEAAGQTIYSLPRPLLDLVIEKTGTSLLSRRDAQFERALAACPGIGFCNGRSITNSPLEQFQISLKTAPIRRRSAGAGVDSQANIRLRCAYTAYLILDTEMFNERRQLLGSHESSIAKLCPLPSLVSSDDRDSKLQIPQRLQKPLKLLHGLQRKWGIERFATWELPTPLDAAVGGQAAMPSADLNESGLHVFLPWATLADSRLTVRDLLNRVHRSENIEHVKPWLRGAPATSGYLTFGWQLVLFVYRIRALNARYGDRKYGSVGLLDRAFTQYLSGRSNDSIGLESVRQLRLRLTKSLANRSGSEKRKQAD
ncbi:hypothetical protein [Stratiformator vulcanicus]|uniref:Uncharacterized protein n=1 Tax=Stratiformator vulcanicus TaxID=2527980 RepID=A0A517QZC8_9PLAN|nr:hypothetical protein [Stratiformator vulcanicus]QDT36900.1 hypothetical protein Pan189_12640 [Stratiformator vulcanicus]